MYRKQVREARKVKQLYHMQILVAAVVGGMWLGFSSPSDSSGEKEIKAPEVAKERIVSFEQAISMECPVENPSDKWQGLCDQFMPCPMAE